MLKQVQDQLLSAICQQSGTRTTKHISFSLPTNHTDKDSTEWGQRRSTNKSTQTGVLDSSIPLAISNTGATASAFKPLDPSVPTGIQSTATFGGAFGEQAAATTMNKLHHKLCKPARSVHIAQQVQNSLLTTSKVVDADYIAIYDKKEVNFYGTKTTKITVMEGSSVKGVAMLSSRIMAVTTRREPSEPQHQHPPIGSSNQAPESKPAVHHANYQA
jgi:hypothetical protein